RGGGEEERHCPCPHPRSRRTARRRGRAGGRRPRPRDRRLATAERDGASGLRGRGVKRLVVAVAALALAGSAPAAPPGLTDPHPCPQEAGFTCSTLRVPLDRSGHVPGTLDLNVAAADNAGASRGVLLFLTGGPGQPGIP